MSLLLNSFLQLTREPTWWNGKCLTYLLLSLLMLLLIRHSFIYTNFYDFLENYPKTAVAKEHVLSRFPGGDWPPGFMEYAFRYFRSPGGTKVEGVSDKFVAEHSDLLDKGLSPEDILKIYVGSKIGALNTKTKASINNDINPKVSQMILFLLYIANTEMCTCCSGLETRVE